MQQYAAILTQRGHTVDATGRIGPLDHAGDAAADGLARTGLGLWTAPVNGGSRLFQGLGQADADHGLTIYVRTALLIAMTPTQLQRIEAQRRCDHVHVHLAGKGGLGGAEAPERRAGIVVGIDQTGPDGEVGDRVGPHRSRRAAEGHFRRLGGIGAVVPDHIGRTGDDGPVVHDAALEPEPSPHTGAAHTQDFFTAKDITYGASLGEHGACQSQHLGIQAALAAKTATLGRSDDADVFLSRIEDSRQFAQTPMRSIGGRPEGEMACYGIITRHTAEQCSNTWSAWAKAFSTSPSS